ncbi:hypothetical protein PBI_ZOEJ_80 [Mycobacterium phage ZoeJ]|uniref:Uncharacterized protein n=2 Tax=Timquatrovirus TaxID=1623306 RepID=A0A222ZS59_9CAUD|nr:hypothetical protein PBI_ZOEJ_80 [Mycobacterium phage ZoeJ]YP_009125555.1 hypothetical protein MILLY_81 [Mycobacterium phage Milly]YP_009951167.1 hypothetical protein I5G77_gp81 [Mycobacterium phage Findley]AHY26904.1 hypothetical protein PBI_ZOEJ_80 [Mycobacterium phage ZoeJ]AJA43753.1 hypothetical protein MILLY_81 [Mycobacterium phage Milly]ASR86820.1 hypothetical protein SEA_FINDLEY_81 [Mycobacterium phage Findley]
MTAQHRACLTVDSSTPTPQARGNRPRPEPEEGLMHNTHVYGESAVEFAVGQRVAVHPITPQFMQGDRYGEVVLVGRTRVSVKLDRSGRTLRFSPQNLAHMARD